MTIEEYVLIFGASDDFDCGDWLLYVVSTKVRIATESLFDVISRLLHQALPLAEVLFMEE